MSKCLHIVTSDAIPFTMRAVGRGDRYGKDMALVHEASQLEAGSMDDLSGPEDPLIEFYDRRFPFEDDPSNGMRLGQFVSRYSLSELLRPDASGKNAFETGINLEGSVPAWSLDAAAMRSCHHALMASGVAPSPEDRKAGWLVVLSDPSSSALDPSRAYISHVTTPDAERSASEWASVFMVFDSVMNAKNDIAEGKEDDAVLGMDTPEQHVTPIFVTDDGAIEFIDMKTGEIAQRHEARQILEQEFGVSMSDTLIQEDRDPEP